MPFRRYRVLQDRWIFPCSCRNGRSLRIRRNAAYDSSRNAYTRDAEYTGGNVDPSVNYSLTLQKEKKVASTLTYTGTDYEGGPIIAGDPDDIFNGNQQGGSVVINETRDDYYLRYNISTELTLAATQQQSLENLNVNDVKTDYAPGEAPRATGTIPAADADKYEIAYECWGNGRQ